MSLSILVIDNFFKDPTALITQAQQLTYNNPKSLPYRRSSEVIAKPEVNQLLKKLKLKYRQMNCYQVMTKRKSFVHVDKLPAYAGIVYLNQNPVCFPGTNFYRHKKLNLEALSWRDKKWVFENSLHLSSERKRISKIVEQDKYILKKWTLTNSVEAKFNRLVLFRTDLFHMNASGWGSNAHNGRLSFNFFLYDK